MRVVIPSTFKLAVTFRLVVVTFWSKIVLPLIDIPIFVFFSDITSVCNSVFTHTVSALSVFVAVLYVNPISVSKRRSETFQNAIPSTVGASSRSATHCKLATIFPNPIAKQSLFSSKQIW